MALTGIPVILSLVHVEAEAIVRPHSPCFFLQMPVGQREMWQITLKDRKGVKNGWIAHPSRLLAQKRWRTEVFFVYRGRPATLDAQPQPSCD
jgi:hypothetical protein